MRSNFLKSGNKQLTVILPAKYYVAKKNTAIVIKPKFISCIIILFKYTKDEQIIELDIGALKNVLYHLSNFALGSI